TTSVKFINVFPLTVLWPGLVVTMVVVALNLFGDALRDAIDPVTNPRLRAAVAVAGRSALHFVHRETSAQLDDSGRHVENTIHAGEGDNDVAEY
ncbi:MAG: ABC transporter permease, partial [Bifidobacteriales bacterium]|nr:ABC transporter permease [Bifidobacteriales bacterium]